MYKECIRTIKIMIYTFTYITVHIKFEWHFIELLCDSKCSGPICSLALMCQKQSPLDQHCTSGQFPGLIFGGMLVQIQHTGKVLIALMHKGQNRSPLWPG